MRMKRSCKAQRGSSSECFMIHGQLRIRGRLVDDSKSKATISDSDDEDEAPQTGANQAASPKSEAGSAVADGDEKMSVDGDA
jgi:hypothetical protein